MRVRERRKIDREREGRKRGSESERVRQREYVCERDRGNGEKG